MLSRPVCPEEGMPIELDDCIYRCFEAYRRRVLERKAARHTKQQQSYLPSQQTEQYQNILSEQLLPPSYNSNLIEDASHYQILVQPTNIATAQWEEYPKSTWQSSNIDQSITLPTDPHYHKQTINKSTIYEEPKIFDQSFQKITSFNDVIKQSQVSTNTRAAQDIHIQPSETITYTDENVQYQALTTQSIDTQSTNQQVVSNSRPTGTIEYTREAYYSQTPILNQWDNTSYAFEAQSLSNQKYADNQFSLPSEETYDQEVDTNEQIVTQNQPSSSYEESTQNYFQQTSSNEPSSVSQIIQETHQQQDKMETNPMNDSWNSTYQSGLIPFSTPNNNEADEHEQEDEEILDLRECICRCYARFKNLWMKDQQNKYQQQFQDIQPPISIINTPPILETNIHHIQRPIPIRAPSWIQPSLLIPDETLIQPSIYPCTQHHIQQSNIDVPICWDHNQQLQQNFQTFEVRYADAWTQTPSCPPLTQPQMLQNIHEEIPATYHAIRSVPDLTTKFIPIKSVEENHIEYQSSPILEATQIVPTSTISIPQPSYHWITPEKKNFYRQTTPICPPIECPPYISTRIPIKTQPAQYQNITYHTIETPRLDPCYTDFTPTVAREKLPESVTRFEQITLPIETPLIPPMPVVSPILPVETPQEIPYISAKLDSIPVTYPETITHVNSLPSPVQSKPMIQAQETGQVQQSCVRCCCVPGRSLIKKVVYKQIQEDNQESQESYVDYGSVIDQLETRINVRYGDSIMEEGEAFVHSNYNEQLRIIDFPVYVSGSNDIDMTPLIPNN